MYFYSEKFNSAFPLYLSCRSEQPNLDGQLDVSFSTSGTGVPRTAGLNFLVGCWSRLVKQSVWSCSHQPHVRGFLK